MRPSEVRPPAESGSVRLTPPANGLPSEGSSSLMAGGLLPPKRPTGPRESPPSLPCQSRRAGTLLLPPPLPG